MPNLTPELYWLTATAIVTGLMWIPYTVQLIREMGPVAAIWDPYHETPIEAKWAQRAKRAHTNAIENLAVFAALSLAVVTAGAGSALTAWACAAFFVVRVAHYVVYVGAVPLLRTVLFLCGLVCQIVLAATLFGLMR